MGLKELFQVEETGIEVIKQEEKTGTPKDLFWVWFASNIGILGIVYGAIIVAYGLSFIQAVAVTLLGALSFTIVGYISLSGRDGGASTLTLSRNIFGFQGNKFPTAVVWTNLMGWEAVNVITGTFTLSALFNTIGFAASPVQLSISLAIFFGLVIVVSFFGQKTIVAIQSIFTWLFGGLTGIVVIYLVMQTDWSVVMQMPSGSWQSFISVLSIIIAGTGISWGIAGADYSRYQSKSVSSKSLMGTVTIAAFIPLFILMTVGVLLASKLPELSSASNPIDVIGSALPKWMTIPYLIAATGGIVSMAVMSLYSAGLNLLIIGVKVRRITAIIIDAIIIIFVAVYILFIKEDFMGPFQAFLIMTGCGLAAFEAMFIIDYALKRKSKGYSVEAMTVEKQTKSYAPLIIWLLGTVAGLLVTNGYAFAGPLSKGIFADSSLGLVLSSLVSGVLYLCYIKMDKDNG